MTDLTLIVGSAQARDCRPISGIIADARAGRLPNIEPLPAGFGHRVVDETAALAAMLRNI